MKICSKRAREVIESRQEIALELGAGGSPESPEFLSVDSRELPGVDLVANLNEPLDRISDGCVSRIYTRHTFEHIENLVGLMHEIHRVCASNAKIHVVVPHFSNAYGFSDPTHVRFFGLYSMDYFQPNVRRGGRLVPHYFPEIPFRVESVSIYFYPNTLAVPVFTRVFEKLVNWSAWTKHFYERWLSSLIRASEIHYHIEAIKTVAAENETLEKHSVNAEPAGVS